MNGKLLVEKLLFFAKKYLYSEALDEAYVRNLLLQILKVETPLVEIPDLSELESLTVPDMLIAEVEEFAKENGLCEVGEENLFSAYVTGLLSPLPSKVNNEFFRIKECSGINAACKYLYDLSVMNGYIRKTDIEKNLKWDYADGERRLEITVNLSKPEKDNKDIAKLLTQKNDVGNYPACALCKENEGFKGNFKKPPRSNLRTVSVNLGGEEWFVQYSPYAYYSEHCIAINKVHANMSVNATTAVKLFDFVDLFPNYFIGSNADLPIVGGSILNHEHYQGGLHVLPMRRAGVKKRLSLSAYPLIKGGVLDWYNNALRFSSKNRKQLELFVAEFIDYWKNYSDESVGLCANEGNVRHSTLSPIAYKSGDGYTVELILRNNITSKEYPDGVFHAHPEFFNIKKEGIGLIEAMGLFILPGRLKKETEAVKKILTGEITADLDAISETDMLYKHKNMIKELLVETGGNVNGQTAEEVVRSYINVTCKKILECTAVFKNDANGEKAFDKCLKRFGFEILN